MPNTPSLLSVKHLKKYFPLARGGMFRPRSILRAVEDISLDIRRGETFGLVGESGCGKSTFGRTVLQLYKPTAGSVLYYGANHLQTDAPNKEQGLDLTQCTAKQMRTLRKDLQIIFQDPYSSLDPRMTVGQIIEEGVATHGFYRRGSAQMRDYVVKIMRDCGLQDYALHRYPHQFSGGQRQRICIARALAVRPKFVLCDECVSALDVSIQSQILNLLTKLKEKEGLTYLFISHDLSVVRHVSDRIGVMYLGRIVELGDAERVFSAPLHPYTIALISAIPDLNQNRGEQILLPGNMPSASTPIQGCPFAGRCFMAQSLCHTEPPTLEEVESGRFVACHFARESTEIKRKKAKENSEK